MSVQEIVALALALPVEERKDIIIQLVNTLDGTQTVPHKKYRLSDLEGVGAEIWQGIDAQEYVNQLRDEWDSRL